MSSFQKYWLIPVFIIIALLTFIPISGKRVRTTHKPVTETKSEQLARKATLVLKDNDVSETDRHYFNEITCAGFDKESTSSVESFFVTNSCDRNVIGLDVEITYFDMKGRQLHKRSEKITSLIPSGETRKIDIRSWDKQHTFFYYKNNRPARKICTPFDIRFRIKTIYLGK